MSHQEPLIELAKATPPIAVSGLVFFGITLSDLLLLLTIIYTIFQICMVARRWIVSRRIGDHEPPCAEDCPVAKKRREGK